MQITTEQGGVLVGAGVGYVALWIRVVSMWRVRQDLVSFLTPQIRTRVRQHISRMHRWVDRACRSVGGWLRARVSSRRGDFLLRSGLWQVRWRARRAMRRGHRCTAVSRTQSDRGSSLALLRLTQTSVLSQQCLPSQRPSLARANITSWDIAGPRAPEQPWQRNKIVCVAPARLQRPSLELRL